MIDIENPLLLLRTAAENERLGYQFFQRAMQITHDPKGKEMFTYLGEEEIKHLRLLLGEIDSLEAGKGWIDPEKALKEKADVHLSEPVASEEEMSRTGSKFDWQDPTGAVKDAGSSVEADLGVLEFGMRIERYFYDMYREALEKLEDPCGRAALEFLMKQENRHYEMLQKARDYLSDNETWWDEWQRPIFEGG